VVPVVLESELRFEGADANKLNTTEIDDLRETITTGLSHLGIQSVDIEITQVMDGTGKIIYPAAAPENPNVGRERRRLNGDATIIKYLVWTSASLKEDCGAEMTAVGSSLIAAVQSDLATMCDVPLSDSIDSIAPDPVTTTTPNACTETQTLDCWGQLGYDGRWQGGTPAGYFVGTTYSTCECACSNNWSGLNCEEKRNDNECSTNAQGDLCQNDAKPFGNVLVDKQDVSGCSCKCLSGFIGDACQSDSTTSCTTGADGQNCTLGYANGSVDALTRSTSGCSCICPQGWGGPNCEIEMGCRIVPPVNGRLSAMCDPSEVVANYESRDENDKFSDSSYAILPNGTNCTAQCDPGFTASSLFNCNSSSSLSHNMTCRFEQPEFCPLMCLPGFYFDRGLDGGLNNTNEEEHCRSCAAGKYTDDPYSFNCISCTPGRIAARNGSTSCSLCNPGYYSSLPGSTTCLACPQGYISASAQSTKCERCIPGRFSFVKNSSNCEACPEGYFKPSPTLSAKNTRGEDVVVVDLASDKVLACFTNAEREQCVNGGVPIG
jgi:hypothetical protein